MTLKEAQAIIADISYKPGFSFSLGLHPSMDMWRLRLSFLVLDAKTKAVVIPISSVVLIAPEYVQDTSDLICFVSHEIRRMELHEIDEWLLYKGKYVQNPHPEICARKEAV